MSSSSDEKKFALRLALIEGQESGDAGPLDFAEIRREARARLKRDRAGHDRQRGGDPSGRKRG